MLKASDSGQRKTLPSSSCVVEPDHHEHLLTLSSVLLEKNLELVAGTDLIAPSLSLRLRLRLLLPRIRSVF
jgi:hypothetical protein